MKRREIIINETEKKFTVGYWREQFSRLYSEEADFDIRDLSKFDTFFITSQGKSAMSNIKRGVAGLEHTMRAVKALEKFIEAKAESSSYQNNLVKRQKLVIPS
jgi:hypothetical protein